jgi:secondary thiamine-phosphate synthase enzyme
MEQALTDVRPRRERVASSSASETVVRCEALFYDTTTAPEFIDITDEVQHVVEESGVAFGQATIFSNHTTAAIKINENEPLLLQDMARILEEIAPRGGEYDHNDFERRTVNMEDEECANGHAHCQHLFLSTSETVPIIDGQLMTGQWQRIFLVELDMPRPRRVLVNIVGVAG